MFRAEKFVFLPAYLYLCTYEDSFSHRSTHEWLGQDDDSPGTDGCI